MAVTAAYGAVLLVSVKRDRTSLTHARLQKLSSRGSFPSTPTKKSLTWR